MQPPIPRWDLIDRYAMEVRWLTERHLTALTRSAELPSGPEQNDALMEATAAGILLAFPLRTHITDAYDKGTRERGTYPEPIARGLPSEPLHYQGILGMMVQEQFTYDVICDGVTAAAKHMLTEMNAEIGAHQGRAATSS